MKKLIFFLVMIPSLGCAGTHLMSTSSLQAGTTFYVSSGTVQGTFYVQPVNTAFNPLKLGFGSVASLFSYGPSIFYQARPDQYFPDALQIFLSTNSYADGGGNETLTGFEITSAGLFSGGGVKFLSDGFIVMTLLSTGVQFSEPVSISSGLILLSTTTPNLTGNTDNWNFGTDFLAQPYAVVRASSTTNINITGIANGLNGKEIRIFNVGPNTLTFKENSSSSAAANRLLCAAADKVVGPEQSVVFWYDSTTQAWRCQ